MLCVCVCVFGYSISHAYHTICHELSSYFIVLHAKWKKDMNLNESLDEEKDGVGWSVAAATLK